MEEFILTIVTILEVQIILFKERVCERDEDGRRRQQVKLLEWIVNPSNRNGPIFIWVIKAMKLMFIHVFTSLVTSQGNTHSLAILKISCKEATNEVCHRSL
jgi:hypothetical protein